MAYFILMGRRIPKQAITGFKFQNETDNIRPFLSIRIRGKDEIIPFKDKKEIQSVKAHLCSIFSGFVKIGDWYLKMSEVKEYKPVTAEDMNPYILFKTSKFGNIYVCVFICFLLWLIFTLLLSFTVIGLVISVSDEWQEMGDKIIDKL